jgi:tripartite ATP-independent transporter DctP family solute receptor
MKKLLFIGVILCGILTPGFAAGAGEGGQKTVTLKYAHVGIAGEIQTRYADELAALVKEKTNGAVVIQVFPNSQLGGANEMVDGVKSGAISMGHHDFATLGKYLTDISVFNAPYIYRDGPHALAATTPKTSPVLQKINEELVKAAGLRVIGSNYRGARQLSANFPVYSPEDLRGKKIRGTPVELWMSMIKGMGAIPTPVEISELYTALLTGMVAGQENPITNIYTQKFHEVQSHIMMTSHMQSILCTFINENAWNSLGAGNQRIMNECLEEMSYKTLEWTNEQEAPVRKAMEDYGVKFIDESNGLKNDLFKQAVNAQIAIDFPGWTSYIQDIQNMK